MSKKKDLELVYNLQWKTKPTNGDDKANIVGMYDIPATTLSWEAFKSYLLKNSGTAGDDVKVSYIYEDKEIAIESQLDFQIALYYFRKKARNGEIITLTLDRSHYEQKIMLANAFSSNDAQTQVNIEENSRKETDKSLLDGPPDWFQKYMTQFKQEVVQDVTASFMNALSRLPSHVVCSSHHSRKSKSDIKRNPKYCDAANEKKEKEILKSMKLERKLENKLEKLERKAIKVKERRLSLLHSHSKDSSQRKVQTSITADDSALRMNAYSPKSAFSSAYHMMGGEIYMQQWEVENNGELPWTSQTELRYAWGSQALNPVSKVVACPKLAPGEVGFINVFLEIPVTPGTYECYWHFYHNSRRFGQWLGCQIVVDPPVMPLFSLSKDRILKQEEFNIDDNIKTDAVKFCNKPDLIQSETKPINNLEELKSIGTAVENLAVNELADCSSDTDNHSIISIADSNTSESSVSLDEFVVLTRELSLSPSAVKDEEISDGVEIINRDTPNDDNNNNTNSANIEAAVEQEAALEQVAAVELEAAVKQEAAVEQELTQEEEGRNNETLGSDYAFVVLEGNKVAVPKAFLRADFLATAEDAPNPHAETLSAFVSQPEEPKVQNTPSVAETKPTYSENFGKTTNSFQLNSEIVPNSSHCSTAGSNLADSITGPNDIDNRSRLFVFPQSCPGFEIVNSMVVPEPHAFAEATPCHHSDPVMPESFVSPRVGVCVRQKSNDSRSSKWYERWLLKRCRLPGTNLTEELCCSPYDWFSALRKDEEMFYRLLHLVSPFMKLHDSGVRGVSPCDRLAATLHFLIRGKICEDSKLTEDEVLKHILPETCIAIHDALEISYLKHPKTESEWQEVALEFNTKWNFPNCMGAVGGKFLQIYYPPGTKTEDSEGHVVITAIVNANYEFIYYDFARIEKTAFYHDLINGTFRMPPSAKPFTDSKTKLPFVFVGDDTIPLRKYFRQIYNHSRLTSEERIYNYRLSRAHRVVRNVFGIISNRFRVINHPNGNEIRNFKLVTATIFLLHNFLLRHGADYYASGNDFDTEDIKTGLITLGLQSQGSFTDFQRGCPMAMNDTLMLRHAFLKYFNNEGALSWQNKFI